MKKMSLKKWGELEDPYLVRELVKPSLEDAADAVAEGYCEVQQLTISEGVRG